MKYKINDVTPSEMRCVVGGCSEIYEAETSEGQVYLIVGKRVEPSETSEGLEGLARRVGEGEVMVEVPRKLIDDRKR